VRLLRYLDHNIINAICTKQECLANIVILQLVSELGRETLNTPVYVQVDVTRCHVVTHLPMRYCLIGEPTIPPPGGAIASGRPVKLLQIAAFAPSSLTASADYNVRVYLVEDTSDALQVRPIYIYIYIYIYMRVCAIAFIGI